MKTRASCGAVPRAKTVLLLLLAQIVPLHAALLATLHTTEGDVIVELQYQQAPQAVANFITLAEGTRKLIDPATGAVVRKRFYDDQPFYRVINESTFKIAQTGSGNGTNAGGGPGYTFKDEFDPALTHVPYVLSMANAGPNTNGSQIFLTGNATIPHLDNVHTIFGLISDPPSRLTIDAIMDAGDNGSAINRVTISRTDPTAGAFNEHVQNLPDCIPAAGRLTVQPGVSTTWTLDEPMPDHTAFTVHRCESLQQWQKLGELYQHHASKPITSIPFDSAVTAKAFYNLALVRYNDVLAPDSTANQTLEVTLPGEAGVVIYFDNVGTGGTIAIGSDTPSPINTITYAPSRFKATWEIESASYVPIRIAASFTAKSPTAGTAVITYYNGLYWQTYGSGPLTITR